MDSAILIFSGALVGWAASVITRVDNQKGFMMNIILGMASALLAGLSFDQFQPHYEIIARHSGWSGLMVAASSATAVLILFTACRRRSPRS